MTEFVGDIGSENPYYNIILNGTNFTDLSNEPNVTEGGNEYIYSQYMLSIFISMSIMVSMAGIAYCCLYSNGYESIPSENSLVTGEMSRYGSIPTITSSARTAIIGGNLWQQV